jgi:hypothetical protein
MSKTVRQNNLFGIQDWTEIYQTFKEADFKSYDYETLRKSMIDYVKTYHPENFNDYINSSEFITLIDLIAFMGQSMSFRFDLNARESFLETAKRRDSVLNLARLINYTPKRNIAAKGLLKITSVSTTEQVKDAFGNSLTNQRIRWNDPSNSNWEEQWNTILNAALVSSQQVGKPGNRNVVDSVTIDEYTLELNPTAPTQIDYLAVVDSQKMSFELVSATTAGATAIYEVAPNKSGVFNILYRDDARGFSSNNTGFFMFFKQGNLQQESFTITESLPNRIITLSSQDINNEDVWLFQQLNDGTLVEWTKVDAIYGNNVIYNDVAVENKKVYSVYSQAGDAVQLIFGDGIFGEIPNGKFIAYARSSNGLNYRINPAEMQGISVVIDYQSQVGRNEKLFITLDLLYTVANSSAKENLDDIKIRAPQSYYSQNRMVNAQDYNTFPFTRYNNILKIKSINRMSSGISRYLDVVDETGRYSATDIFGQDGYVYSDPTTKQTSFEIRTRDDAVSALQSVIEPAIASAGLLAFFYENYASSTISTTVNWKMVQTDNNTSNGYLTNESGQLVTVGGASTQVPVFPVGAIAKFEPADTGSSTKGYVFSNTNDLILQAKTFNAATLTNEVTVYQNQSLSIYAAVKSVVSNGAGNASPAVGTNLTSEGAISLSEKVPTNAQLKKVYPAFVPVINNDLRTQIVTKMLKNEQFGLGYRTDTNAWYLIVDATGDPLDITAPFEELIVDPLQPPNAGKSWLIAFEAPFLGSNIYTLYQRSIETFFGSELETRFFYDPAIKIYDPQTGKLIRDAVTVIRSNAKPTNTTNVGYSKDIDINISGRLVESDGFVDDTRIKVTYADKDTDGIPDNPVYFTDIVGDNSVAVEDSSVFFKKQINADGFESFYVVPKGEVKVRTVLSAVQADKFSYANGDVIYLSDETTPYFIVIVRSGNTVSTVVENNYIRLGGRQNIKFQYRHNAPADRRIDPSPSNIVDLFILEKNYANEYITWIRDVSGSIPDPEAPTTESLRNDFIDLENYKMISDLLIFSPAKFRPLFGIKAEPTLRAKFLVVKNLLSLVSDSEIKSRMILEINDYFAVENWDFGETFYFSELAAFLHAKMSDVISSVHIVPLADNQVYGDLQQIRCLPDEIFTSAATVNDIEVTSNLTLTQLRAV